MNRMIPITLIAGAATFGLFAFMAQLIKSDSPTLVDVEEYVPVDFLQIPQETKVIPRVRQQIQPPEPPPVMEVTRATATGTDVNTEFDYTPTGLTVKNTLSDFSLGGQLTDKDAAPVFRTNPKYPMKALTNGIEGWVKMTFDINEIGQVINIEVIDAQPKRIFDRAAKSALKKWKYKAKMLDGKAIVQRGFVVQLDFNMQEQI